MNFRSLTVAAALAYPMTLIFYGCAHGARLFGPAQPDGCRDVAAVYSAQSSDSLDCHPTATKVLVVAEGFAMHVCRCPASLTEPTDTP